MQWRDLFADWGLNKLQLKAGFLSAEFCPQDADRNAAWELYVELATRVSTQPLASDQGVEKQALASLYSLLKTTREIMKRHGPSAKSFTRIGIAVLNRILRPFLTRWHRVIDSDALLDAAVVQDFRRQLEEVRGDLLGYAAVLAKIADVEDLT